MDVPTELVVAAITGAAGLLGYNTKKVYDLDGRIKSVEKRLPNGEVQAMYNMMKTLVRESGKVTPAMEEEWKRVDEATRQEGAEYDDI